MRSLPLSAAFLGFLCATSAVAGAQPAPQIGAPRVDHHQHLWREEATAFTTTPPLPEVVLPPAFAELMQALGGPGSDRAAALTPLYADDAVVLDPGGAIFLKGREAAAAHAAGRGAAVRAVPVAFGLEGASGWIAGSFAEGAGASTRHVADFLLALRRDGDGRWRIAAESTTAQPPRVGPRSITAEQLIAKLDAAGVRRAVVLSSAYFYGSPYLPTAPDETARVRAENDWVAAQVARFPDRLVGFCGVNPLKPYAVDEVRRCAGVAKLRGLKLHFANSGVDLFKPEHLAAVRRVFRAANALRLPIVAHVWVPGPAYGARHSQAFLEQVLPEAPDVVVQIAHLTGTGPGYFDSTDRALAVFVDAIAAGDRRTRNLYFDVASNVAPDQSPQRRAQIAARIRALGLTRVLFGSDSGEGNQSPATAWATFRQLPLTAVEFQTIANNEAPFLR